MSIHYIIIKSFFADLSAKERATLDEWLSDENHKQTYSRLFSHIGGKEDVVEILGNINVEAALAKTKRKARLASMRSKVVPLMKWGVAASVVALLGIKTITWYDDYTMVTPPEISTEIQQSMRACISAGRMAEPAAECDTKLKPITKEELESYDLNDDVVEQLLEAKRIVTYHDKEFWLTLDDGTLVHINNNTRLIYPEKFGRGDRDVILDGEAYFMVAKDKSRPFIVHTARGDVKVYGTEFFVDTHNATTAATDVVLIKGSVGVTSHATSQETMIKPGEQLSLETNDETNVTTVDLTPYVAWNSGSLSFHEKRLDDVLYILSRWYDLSISYENSELRDKLISGTLDRYETIENILSSLSKSTGTEMKVKGNYIVVK